MAGENVYLAEKTKLRSSTQLYLFANFTLQKQKWDLTAIQFQDLELLSNIALKVKGTECPHQKAKARQKNPK